MDKMQEILLDQYNIKVSNKTEENDLIQCTFDFDINEKDFNIVMQVENALDIIDMKEVYSGYMSRSIKKSLILKRINDLDVIVNDKILLSNIIKNKKEGKLEGINLIETGKLIEKLIESFIYFCMVSLDVIRKEESEESKELE
jgi:hypothetical protein